MISSMKKVIYFLMLSSILFCSCIDQIEQIKEKYGLKKHDGPVREVLDPEIITEKIYSFDRVNDIFLINKSSNEFYGDSYEFLTGDSIKGFISEKIKAKNTRLFFGDYVPHINITSWKKGKGSDSISVTIYLPKNTIINGVADTGRRRKERKVSI